MLPLLCPKTDLCQVLACHSPGMSGCRCMHRYAYATMGHLHLWGLILMVIPCRCTMPSDLRMLDSDIMSSTFQMAAVPQTPSLPSSWTLLSAKQASNCTSSSAICDSLSCEWLQKLFLFISHSCDRGCLDEILTWTCMVISHLNVVNLSCIHFCAIHYLSDILSAMQ